VTPRWKTSFEIELLASRGCSRRDLAARIARRHGGSVRRFFHPQQEPSKVAGRPTFENLTPGFAALDRNGHLLASFVDDAKVRIGAKILVHDEKVIDEFLGQARARFTCRQGLNFGDAAKVADLWTAAPAD
jgi:hypothetical protein